MTHARWTKSDDVSDEQLLQHWERLTHHLSFVAQRSYSLTWEDREDIVSTIQLQLLKMPRDKRPFIGYARTTISNAVAKSVNQIVRRGGTPWDKWKHYSTVDYLTAAPAADSDDNDQTAALDRLTPGESPEDDLTWSLALTQAMEQLSAMERDCFALYYRDGYTMAEIAEQVGYSPEWVRQHLSAAVAEVKRRLK